LKGGCWINSSGKEFQNWIDLGKNELLYQVASIYVMESLTVDDVTGIRSAG